MRKNMKNVKGSLSLTAKLGEREGLIGEELSIKELIEEDPIKLWKLIHSPDSKISLVKSTYFKLKAKISKVAPELIEVNEKVALRKKTLRKVAIEKHLGFFGTKKSSFRSLGKPSSSE